MNLYILISTLLLFYIRRIGGVNAHNIDDVLDILKNISGRIANIEAKVDGLVTLMNKLDQVYECGWPEIENGYFKGNSTYFRSVLRSYCDDGYSLFGSYEVTCTSDGVWSELPICRRNCMSPRIPHSTIYNENRTYIYGQQLNINCVFGYRALLSRRMECRGTYWSGYSRCNPVDCGYPPRSDHGSYIGGIRTEFNNTVSLTCDEGYEMIGSDFIRCNGYREWVGAQECLSKVCVNVTNDDGKNTTECLFKQEHSYYFDGNDNGSLDTSDPLDCIRFCLTSHKQFSYIRMSAVRCSCVNKTGKEYVYRSKRYDDVTYIREGEMDDIYMYD